MFTPPPTSSPQGKKLLDQVRDVLRACRSEALSAILFLYRYVLNQEIDPSAFSTLRAERPQRLPTVLTREEALAVLDKMSGVHRLMARLLYGSGMRLTPALAP